MTVSRRDVVKAAALVPGMLVGATLAGCAAGGGAKQGSSGSASAAQTETFVSYGGYTYPNTDGVAEVAETDAAAWERTFKMDDTSMGSLTDAGVAAPLVLGDAVYVAGGRVLVKLDAASGDAVEQVDLPYAVGGSTGVSVMGASESAGASKAPAPGDRSLIVALQDGGLVAYDEGLEELWQTDPLESPAASEGTGLVGEWYATRARAHEGRAYLAQTFFGSAAESRVRCIDLASGEEQWSVTLADPIMSNAYTSNIALCDLGVVVPTAKGLDVLDFGTGEVIAGIDAEFSVHAPIVEAYDGALLVCFDDNSVAFATVDDGSLRLVNRGWPAKRGDKGVDGVYPYACVFDDMVAVTGFTNEALLQDKAPAYDEISSDQLALYLLDADTLDVLDTAEGVAVLGAPQAVRLADGAVWLVFCNRSGELCRIEVENHGFGSVEALDEGSDAEAGIAHDVTLTKSGCVAYTTGESVRVVAL